MEIFVAHHHPTSSSTSSSVAGGNNNNNNNNRPFRDHDVREWSRIDAINGVLEKARLETDNWAASTKDSTHRYAKVVDSRARTGIDGSHLLQAQASKKFEIFQSKSGGNRVQVVKTHSISKWTATATSSTNNNNGADSSSLKAALGFDGLQLPVNPLLNLSSEKSKASVGRTANRRPPSRHHPQQQQQQQQQQNLQFTATTNLHRVSRLCHQIHENAVRNAFAGRNYKSTTPRRGSADGSVNSSSGVEIVEIENISDDTSSQLDCTKKSNSSDDLQQIPEKDNNNKEINDNNNELENWKRDSKLRRSLQSSNTSVSNTVKKLREELDKGRRLSTALKNNSISVDLNALDHIIQSISSVNNSSTIIDDNNLDELLLINEQNNNNIKKKKRESFVTVESLQEVKGRLKHRSTSSDSSSPTKNNPSNIDDDGINVTETDDIASSRMKSYIYGMNNNNNMNNNDKMSHKKSVLGDGTGSLESRTKFFNGTNTHKTEDWYNRRKSYGFEKVHEPDETASISSLKDKTLVESSTDSGICRSSEIMIPSSTATKITSNINNNNNNGRYNSSDSISESELEKFNNNNNNNNKAFNGINYGNVKKMTSIFDQENKNSDELVNNKVWSKRGFLSIKDHHHGEIKSTTITIPIVKNNNVVDLSWNDDNQIMEDLLNRKTKKVEFCKTEVHFAAESGKVNIVETDEKPPPTQNFRRKRRAQLTYPTGDFNKNGLPVLHFGDSSFEKSMFGINNNITSDSNEEISHSQKAFTVVTVNSTAELSSNNNSEDDKVVIKDFNSTAAAENDNLKGILKNKPIKPKPYHLGENSSSSSSITQINNNNDSEDSDSSSSKWGIKLRHVKDSAPIWKSTVTVHNNNNNPDVPEFKKLLKNLKPASPSSSLSLAKKPDYLSDNENRYSSDSFSNIKVISSTHRDNRRSSWSVADQIKLVDDDDDDDIIQENIRGLYSTKVNFGNGEATVVEENEQTKNINNNWQLENLSKDDEDDNDENKPIATYNKYSIHGNNNSKFSPVVLRKTVPIKVNNNNNNNNNNNQQENNNKSSINEFRNISDVKLRAKCANDHHVLRQPKQSEMSYFGVGVTQKTAKIKESLQHHHQKPDLLQNHPSSRINKPRKSTPEKDLEEITFSGTSPIYENLKPQLMETSSTKLHHHHHHRDNYHNNKKEFDSSILDELTKAADQILQAVNDYTSEDCQNRLMMSSDAEDEPRVILDTISETKSWKSQKKQDLEIKNQQRSMRPTLASAAKIRVKRTSSTSSVESLSTNNNRRNNNNNKSTPSTLLLQSSTNNKTLVEKSRKKTITNNNNDVITTSRASSTKARRLQRASSREALLQSHGSSSEDLPSNIEAPPRKPRLIKKTKTAQLTVSNGMEMKRPIRKSREEKVDSISKNSNKQENRILGSLPETRYKSAVSAITNIPSEKSSTRERSKNRIEHKTYKQQEYNNNKGTMSSSSTRPTTTTSSNRNNSNNHHLSSRTNKEPNVTQHRISTANIKRCHRSESSTRH